MTALTAFGLATVTGMMLCYALENRAPGFTLGFAFFCAGASVYGWLAGTWPFGIVEAVWAAIALARWYQHYRT